MKEYANLVEKEMGLRKILESCPTCGGALEIAEVHCTVCATEVRARYRPCDFCVLTEEQSTFLAIFVTSRGNLSEVEKRLGVSYPTVRAKLDEVIERLGAREGTTRAAPAPAGDRRRAPGVETRAEAPAAGVAEGARTERRRILEAVARGEISAAEGMVRIGALGGGHADEL